MSGFHAGKYDGYQQILNLLYLRVLITAELGEVQNIWFEFSGRSQREREKRQSPGGCVPVFHRKWLIARTEMVPGARVVRAKAASVAEACCDVNEKMLKRRAGCRLRQMCNMSEVIVPWCIFRMYFTVREERGNTNPNPWTTFWMEEFQEEQVYWCGTMLKSAPWPCLCCTLKSSLSSTRLFIAACFQLSKPLHMFQELFYRPLTAHLHGPAFATLLVCILLFGLLSVQRQGHNHLLACILANS